MEISMIVHFKAVQKLGQAEVGCIIVVKPNRAFLEGNTCNIIGMTMHNGCSRSLRKRHIPSEDCEEQSQSYTVRAFQNSDNPGLEIADHFDPLAIETQSPNHRFHAVIGTCNLQDASFSVIHIRLC